MIGRREFLALTGVAAAHAASAPAVGFAFGTYGMKTLSTRDALRTIAEIGYDGVELALMPGWAADPARLGAGDRQDIRRMLLDHALALPAIQDSLAMTGTPQKRAYNLERVKLASEMAHALSPSDPPCFDTVLGSKTAEWETAKGRMLDELHAWARIAESDGMTIAVKPHANQAMDTPAKALWMIGQLRSPRVRLVYDYSHMCIGGFPLEQSLRELLPETALIVMKDARGTPERHEFLLPGEGSTDYAAYFRLLKQLGYRGFASVEVSSMIFGKPGYDPVTAARLSYQRLAPVFEKAGLHRGNANKNSSLR